MHLGTLIDKQVRYGLANSGRAAAQEDSLAPVCLRTGHQGRLLFNNPIALNGP
jgi:hypothetical protein